MHDASGLAVARVRRELSERVRPAMYSRSLPFELTAWDAPGEPVPYAEAIGAEYRPVAVGEKWGRPWGTTWFRLSIDVPAGWVGPALEAVIDLGFHQDATGFQCEGMVWTAAGPLQGVHPRRSGVPLPEIAAGPLTLFVEAAANPTFVQFRPSSFGSLDTAGDDLLYRLRRADLAVRDDEVHELLLDVEVLLGMVESLPAVDTRRRRVLAALTVAFDRLDLAAVGATAATARAELAPVLALSARAGAHRVVAVGHAHIDTAWLWPLRETVRKCLRTFASAVRLMDDDPNYRFVCSQAAQYDWVEQRAPELFARITEKVTAGQWEPVGGMWVEADMNLPSGESLVRQLVHGQRYFESRFGVRCREVWIPDVFGYPASAPQIFAAAGCDRFVTQKLSWNKQNRFPHSTFRWRGLDGTEVLTHFPPVDTYNATIVPSEVLYAEGNFKEHAWSSWSLMPYGHGNGGGGPTREMVGRAHRMADLDGVTPIELGTVDEFFSHVEAEVAAGAPVPVWDGELYFEMHRGTLTSQTDTKLGNRRCERLLREAELWWAACGDVPDDVIELLDASWREVLLHQFHDILPGSSIAWVHADTEAAHARVATALEQSIERALAQLGPAQPMIANSAGRARREVVAFATTPPGSGPMQTMHDGRVAHLADVPGLGLGIAEALVGGAAERVTVTEHSFTNEHLAVNWNLAGDIVSIIDLHAGRELLPPGRSIQLELAPDHPVEYDAWDLESWTTALGEPLEGVTTIEVIDSGPLVATLRVRRSFGSSSAVTDVTLRAGSPRLDFALDVDWHEDERLLTLMVPLDVRAREAACDIQYGHVMRPTHPSSPWDAAKFEVCAHRFVDLAEPNWGVAVLSDGRYGHGLFDGGVRVSLLRAAKYPDPDADHGRHRVTISVLPHGPGLHDVLHQAEALNEPLRWCAPAVRAASGPPPPPVVSVDHPGVMVSAVKRADDGSGHLVVRLAEVCGNRSRVTLRTPLGVGSAELCDVLEEAHRSIDVTDGVVVLALRPFELVTVRLAPRQYAG